MIPPRTILAATDFSDASLGALRFAARLARHCDAALHIVHAEHPLLSTAAERTGVDLAGETREELRRLIIVGSHGMSGAEKLVFGSTTEGLLRQSNVSVLVAPPEWTPPRPSGVDLAGIGPVITGVDMTESSIAVVPELAVLARWRPHAEQVLEERVTQALKELERIVRGLGCAAPIEWRSKSVRSPTAWPRSPGEPPIACPSSCSARRRLDQAGARPVRLPIACCH